MTQRTSLWEDGKYKDIKVGAKMPVKLRLQPNHYAKDLLEAANIVLYGAKDEPEG